LERAIVMNDASDDPMQAAPASDGLGSNQTFLFADLAGFTALTEVHGDEHAADLVEAFCAELRPLLREHAAEQVKVIGDAVMVRSADAAEAVRLGLRLAREVGGRHRFPAVRVGVHTGPAVERRRDWFGSTINLASRVSEAASGGEVLLTAATREAASEPEGVRLRRVGTREFKNVTAPVELFAAELPDEHLAGRLVTDPVCRMALDPSRSPEHISYRGSEYCFCSAACAATFAKDPNPYLPSSSRGELRVSDAARERAVSLLRRAYESGRLSVEELDQRVAHAYAARTRKELGTVVKDLPEYRRQRRAARRRAVGRALAPWRWRTRRRRR
jgi:adenylate cyclase